MKRISEIIEVTQENMRTNSKKSQPRTSLKTALPLSWVSAIFSKLQLRYGARWVSASSGVEKEMAIEWSDGLSGLTGDQIAQGLKFEGEWPPSLPEFKAACTGKHNGKNEYGLDYIPQYYRVVETDKTKLLSSGERDAGRERFKENMQNLKNKLRGK